MVQYTLGKKKLNKIIDATVYERDRGRERERENTKESHKGGKQVNIEQSAVKVFFRFLVQHVRQGVANDGRVCM